jgi:flagellar hook-basal body complex protein FliE
VTEDNTTNKSLEQRLDQESVPRVLRERLLVTQEHRNLLHHMTKLLPRNTAILYEDTVARKVPSSEELAKNAKMDVENVREKLYELKKIWNLPEVLPTNSDRLTEDQALILALANQHKMRWDPDMKDYSVPRIHMFSGELGLGTLYTNTEAFEGERIFRKAIGIDEMVNSVHFQGGVMPQVVSFYGKLKNNRALMMGQNRKYENLSEKEWQEKFQEEIDEIKDLLQRATNDSFEMTADQYENLKTFVVNTIDSYEEAAESVAYDLRPLVENLPEHVPIFVHMSYNDDFNKSELETLTIEGWRQAERQANKAEKRIPELEDVIVKERYRFAEESIFVQVGERVLDKLSEFEKDVAQGNLTKREVEQYHIEGTDLLRGKKLREALFDKYFNPEAATKKLTSDFERFKEAVKRGYQRRTGELREDEESVANEYFEERFEEALEKYLTHANKLMEWADFEKRLNAYRDRQARIQRNIDGIRDKIHEYRQIKLARDAENRGGHSSFTKQYAIYATQSKGVEMAVKSIYSKYYTEILFPTLRRLTGKNLNLHLVTDTDISLYIPDPGQQHGKHSYADDDFHGTIITSLPRPNRQRSNEPVKSSIDELIGKHESAIRQAQDNKQKRPKKVSQFHKRKMFGLADIAFTSWGSDGYIDVAKVKVGETTVEGEYRDTPEIINYLSLPTRHDAEKLSDLAKRGNTGTWEVKRMEKGGGLSGNVYQVYEADGSALKMMVEDKHYKKIEHEFGPKVRNLEDRIARTKSEQSRARYQKQLQKLYDEIRPEIFWMLLDNDGHHGVFCQPGRPTNDDSTKASQTAALQTLGPKNIKMLFGTEQLNGYLSFKGYDPKYEDYSPDPATLRRNVEVLYNSLREDGVSYKKSIEMVETYREEMEYARSVVSVAKQLEQFDHVRLPMYEEVLRYGATLEVGAGNHNNDSREGSISEADLIGGRLPREYRMNGQVHLHNSGRGNSFSGQEASLPARVNDFYAYLSHKMHSGKKAEVAAMVNQLLGMRTRAKYAIGADRHQGGQMAEKGAYAVLDFGKQPTNGYVSNIGKAGSLRGTTAVGIPSQGEKILLTRSWLDTSIDPIIGWDERKKDLEKAHSLLRNKNQELYGKPVPMITEERAAYQI